MKRTPKTGTVAFVPLKRGNDHALRQSILALLALGQQQVSAKAGAA